MTPELTALALAGLLQAPQFALFAIPANIELTRRYTSPPAIRLRRAAVHPHCPPAACNEQPFRRR